MSRRRLSRTKRWLLIAAASASAASCFVRKYEKVDSRHDEAGGAAGTAGTPLGAAGSGPAETGGASSGGTSDAGSAGRAGALATAGSAGRGGSAGGSGEAGAVVAGAAGAAGAAGTAGQAGSAEDAGAGGLTAGGAGSGGEGGVVVAGAAGVSGAAGTAGTAGGGAGGGAGVAAPGGAGGVAGSAGSAGSAGQGGEGGAAGATVYDGNYYVAGPWAGYVSAFTDELGASFISPQDFGAKAPDDPYCVDGTVGATPEPSGWALIQFNLNQARGSTTAESWTPSGTEAGVVVDVSNLGASPLWLQLQQSSGTPWCAILTTFDAEVTVPWSSFNTACWDNSGSPYNQEPLTSLGFMVPGGQTVDTPFSFCVHSLRAAN